MLNVVTGSFYSRREQLEALGFPPKLPGLNGWSRAAILRWIETNGGTYLPAAPSVDDAASALEREYAR
jgi:hypothetical protein